MKVLNEVQTDSVGGGLQFVGYTGSNGWDSFYRDYLGGMGSGGQITSGSYFSFGSSPAGSASEPYGSHMVNPTGCRNDVILAGLAGAIVGVYLGKNSVGGAIAGGAAGFGIGGFAALKLSADCQPKQP